mmetsp:Transcript_6276/g.15432  ORF Transcript_6276/g.15432 Transcript_6276/m.15432 type:complete len:726 (+) Transcript_6276:69-2246(+)
MASAPQLRASSSDRHCQSDHCPEGPQVGEPAQVFSRSANDWIDGIVMDVTEDGQIRVEYKVGKDRCGKTLPLDSEDLKFVGVVASDGGLAGTAACTQNRHSEGPQVGNLAQVFSHCVNDWVDGMVMGLMEDGRVRVEYKVGKDQCGKTLPPDSEDLILLSAVASDDDASECEVDPGCNLNDGMEIPSDAQILDCLRGSQGTRLTVREIFLRCNGRDPAREQMGAGRKKPMNQKLHRLQREGGRISGVDGMWKYEGDDGNISIRAPITNVTRGNGSISNIAPITNIMTGSRSISNAAPITNGRREIGGVSVTAPTTKVVASEGTSSRWYDPTSCLPSKLWPTLWHKQTSPSLGAGLASYPAAAKEEATKVVRDTENAPTVAPVTNITKEESELLGVSVAYLEREFLAEIVDKFGPRADPNYYDINPVMLYGNRAKGFGKICPRDHQRHCSYVDALPDQHKARATVMLSWCWQYTAHIVVDALVRWCQQQGHSPSRVFVWQCAVCINQYRVEAKKAIGGSEPFERFRETFERRVCDIGHVLALLLPWDRPHYIARMWCVFEFWMALETSTTNLEVILPQSEVEAINNAAKEDKEILVKNMFDNVKIQRARASVDDDRRNILRLVDPDVSDDDYDRSRAVHALNMEVTNRLLDFLQAAVIPNDAQILYCLQQARAPMKAREIFLLCNRMDPRREQMGEGIKPAMNRKLYALEKARRITVTDGKWTYAH